METTSKKTFIFSKTIGEAKYTFNVEGCETEEEAMKKLRDHLLEMGNEIAIALNKDGK